MSTDKYYSTAAPTDGLEDDERAKRVSTPEARMRRGKRLVLSGFAVAVAGMIGYCVAGLLGGASSRIGMALLDRPEWLIVPTLATIAIGTLLWLVGSFVFLLAAMDSDSDDEIHF